MAAARIDQRLLVFSAQRHPTAGTGRFNVFVAQKQLDDSLSVCRADRVLDARPRSSKELRDLGLRRCAGVLLRLGHDMAIVGGHSVEPWLCLFGDGFAGVGHAGAAGQRRRSRSESKRPFGSARDSISASVGHSLVCAFLRIIP